METKPFWVITLGNGEVGNIPKSTSVQIENTSTAGVVSVSNIAGATTQTFTILPAGVQIISGSWLSSEMTVTCDADATAQIIYHR